MIKLNYVHPLFISVPKISFVLNIEVIAIAYSITYSSEGISQTHGFKQRDMPPLVTPVKGIFLYNLLVSFTLRLARQL